MDDISNVCFVCLENVGILSVYEEDVEGFTSTIKIFECTGVMITPDMNFPEKICPKCFENMNTAYEFRMMVRTSVESLIMRQTKQEEPDTDDQEELDNSSFYILEESSDLTGENTVYDAEDLDATEINFGTEGIEGEVMEEDQHYSIIEEIVIEESEMKFKKPEKEPNSEVLSKRIRKKTQPAILKRRPGEKKTFICELCGNQYKIKSQLDKHVRWHNNIKPYPCEICSRRFSEGCNLKKHMLTHTGERPYACCYCDQRFALQKTRIQHERTHTGERPYTCTTCGKSFAYMHVLANHMQVHTGEKPYECVPCKKKFAKKHQLKCHEETLTHRAQVETYKSKISIAKVNF